MLTVKLMSDENMPDTDQLKSFQLIQVSDRESIHFFKEGVNDQSGDFNAEYPYTLSIENADGVKVMYALKGNAYVISESGKTIASHGC